MTRPDPSSLEDAKARYAGAREAAAARGPRPVRVAERAPPRPGPVGRPRLHPRPRHRGGRRSWSSAAGSPGCSPAINLARRGITNFRIVEKAGRLRRHLVLEPLPGLHVRRRRARSTSRCWRRPATCPPRSTPARRRSSATASCSARHFGLYEHALFQTEVESLTWDDERAPVGPRSPAGRPDPHAVLRRRPAA